MNLANLTKKKVIIVGAGLSGLTAGIYCLDNGFDVEIYEKHSIPGGECTGWTRRGQYIDGCAHWIVGTNPRSELYPLWERIGAFENNPAIFKTEYISKFTLDNGKVFTFWADLDKLQNEMLEFFPEDKKNIRKFINTVRAYRTIHVPAKKPLDHMNFLEFIPFGLTMIPAAYPFLHFKHISVEEYIQRFNNKELGQIINRFMEGNYNIHSFFYVCQAVSKNDAGMIEGGSLELMKRVAERFKRMGGILHLNQPIKKIHIENDNAKGIVLENDEIVNADYVISSCDAYHTMHTLLEDKYDDEVFREQFANPEAYPINTSIMLAFKTKKNLNTYPKMMDFKIDHFDLFGKETNHYGVRNFSFDKTLPSIHDETLLTVLLPANEVVYHALKAMDKETYQQAKKDLGKTFVEFLKRDIGFNDGEIECIDVCTPLTYERYTNAYMGSYMSFITTKHTKGLMRPGLIKGLHNFVLAGQWIMPPGGLPIALISGKHAVQRICKMEGKKFVNKEIKPSLNLSAKKPKIA